MRGSIAFFSLMALASVVSVLKLTVLAAVLPPADFTHYASAFALVALTSSLISFGVTEGSVKRFTRLILFRRSEELRASLRRDIEALTIRHVIALVIIGIAAGLVGGIAVGVTAAAIIVQAYAANCFAMGSSLLRAFGRLTEMGLAAIIRATLALAAAALFGVYFGWLTGFGVEAAASALAGVALLYAISAQIRRTAASAAEAPILSAEPVAKRFDGVILFLAFSIALIPTSFDRLWVTHFAAVREGAQYAFAGIWIVAAYTVTSIYVQKFGPEIIRKAKSHPAGLLKTSLVHSLVLAVVIAAGALASLAVIYFLMHHIYWEKYHLDAIFVMVTVLAAAFNVSPILDWALIAVDAERGVLAAAVAFFLTTGLAFAIAAYLGLGSTWYIAALGAGRIVQMAVAAAWLLMARSPATSR